MSLNPSRLSARVSSNKQLYAHRDNANQKSEGSFSLIDETEMPKPRQRACLEQGLKLDLNKLTRQGLMRRGAKVGRRIINRWTYSYTGEEIARGCRHCEHGRQIRGLAEDPNQKPRPVDRPSPSASTFRWTPMVLRVPCHTSTLFGVVDASGRDALLQPPNTAKASRLLFTIWNTRRSGTPQSIQNQIAIDRQS